MIQLDSIINMLNDVPDNSTLRLRTIVEGCLITELPNGIQNRLKSMSTRGPGRGDTCHLTDFSETWPD